MSAFTKSHAILYTPVSARSSSQHIYRQRAHLNMDNITIHIIMNW